VCRTLHQLPDPPGEKKKKNVSFFGIGFPTKKNGERKNVYLSSFAQRRKTATQNYGRKKMAGDCFRCFFRGGIPLCADHRLLLAVGSPSFFCHLVRSPTIHQIKRKGQQCEDENRYPFFKKNNNTKEGNEQVNAIKKKTTTKNKFDEKNTLRQDAQ